MLHYGNLGEGPELKPGMFFTIEPMINMGDWKIKILKDGWTAVTKDKSLSAQFEHTIGITENGNEIFTLSHNNSDFPIKTFIKNYNIMISRYNRPKIEAIWSNENKFRIWTEIECLIAEQLSILGIIPKEAAKDIRKNIKFNVDEINEIEKETHHDVIAYIDNVSNYIGENSKYFHHGVTSSGHS